jgi:hypothetical protein
MSNVVRLPDSAHRSWAIFERDLRAGLAPDLNEEELDHILGAIKPAYLKWSNPAQIDSLADPEAAVAALNVWVRQMTFGLLLSLAAAELALHRQTRGRR